MNGEGRPTTERPATYLDNTTLRRQWAADVMARGRSRGDIPVYGSHSWAELPDNDWRKLAAAVERAEHSLEPVEPRSFISDPQQVTSMAHALRVDALTMAELNERRAQRDDDGDYLGGPVRWSS